uniref:(northern house mosquito) hypothetical protein n=1 Tax=Culex pipiens TaxID=7175 RepID=A0A8D8H9T0_CULPI
MADLDGILCDVGRWRILPTDFCPGCTFGVGRGSTLGKFLLVCSAVLRYSNLLLQVRSGRDFSVWIRYRGGRNGARAICNLDGVQHGAIADFFTGGFVLRLRGSRHTIRFDRTKMLTHIVADVVLCVGGRT